MGNHTHALEVWSVGRGNAENLLRLEPQQKHWFGLSPNKRCEVALSQFYTSFLSTKAGHCFWCSLHVQVVLFLSDLP